MSNLTGERYGRASSEGLEDYLVISNNDAFELERNVQVCIEQGYKPLGGIAVFSCLLSGELIFIQALEPH